MAWSGVPALKSSRRPSAPQEYEPRKRALLRHPRLRPHRDRAAATVARHSTAPLLRKRPLELHRNDGWPIVYFDGSHHPGSQAKQIDLFAAVRDAVDPQPQAAREIARRDRAPGVFAAVHVDAADAAQELRRRHYLRRHGIDLGG